MRMMPEKTVRSRQEHVCGFCGNEINTGMPHSLYRAFDPDRSRDGGNTWGAWVEERRHMHCRPQALQPVAAGQSVTVKEGK